MRRRPAADQFAIAGRFAAVSQWIRRLAFHLQFRRAVLFLVNIGVPVLVGLARNESGAALVGGITGLFLSLADTEGTLGRRLRMVTLVACGIAVGGVLGVWVKIFHPILWIVFFLAAFTSGLLNQVGKGPHFALRFGAISLAVVAALPTLMPVDYAYLAGAVLLSIVSRVLDHLINGPLQSAGPWFSAASFDRSGWVRFALAYALASTVGLWIGIQSGSIRAVWISAITLVLMVPNVRTTYGRVFEGVLGTALAVGTVWIIIRFWHSPGLLSAIILLTAFFLPSQLTRFWAFIGMIAVIVLLAWDLANGDPALEPALLLERLVDVFVAASLVLIVTAILFPRTTWSILKRAESQS